MFSEPDPLGAARLRALYARVPLGMRLGLDSMRRAAAEVGNPERELSIVHVAGTNGKGSVCALIESMARAAGLRTGLYTSPHLSRFAERIRLDGVPMDDDALGAHIDRALRTTDILSFFEATTLAAFLAFREAKVDLAVVEVGLGGRLDATNIIETPKATAITRIAFDHTDRLGNTLAAIAREKAGIAKRGVPMVLGPLDPEADSAAREVADAVGAPCFAAHTDGSVARRARTCPVGLVGAHQRDNLAVAFALAGICGIDEGAQSRGAANVAWPGRMETVSLAGLPVLLDAAHNPDGADALASHVRSLGIRPDRVCLVFGAMGDKEWQTMQDRLAPLSTQRIYVEPSLDARAARPAASVDAMAERWPGRKTTNVADALAAAAAANVELVVVAGSIYLVGEVRGRLVGQSRDPATGL
jgi:dihydrofolate synthase/folylpolyglutamate synthase